MSSQPSTTGAIGDTATFSYANSKLSDADINALAFTMIKFEPVSSSYAYATTYFTLDGQPYGSHTTRYPTRFATTVGELAAGTWHSNPACSSFPVCNFGRGHCPGNVQSAQAFTGGHAPCTASSTGPIVGVGGVTTGEARIYVWA